MENLSEHELKEINGGYTIKMVGADGVYFLNLDTGELNDITGKVVFRYY